MKLSILLAICSGVVVLSGCSSNSSSLVKNEGVTETTGYWYLGDNGQRQWRTFTSETNNKEDAFKKGSKIGISPFGSGSGH